MRTGTCNDSDMTAVTDTMDRAPGAVVGVWLLGKIICSPNYTLWFNHSCDHNIETVDSPVNSVYGICESPVVIM